MFLAAIVWRERFRPSGVVENQDTAVAEGYGGRFGDIGGGVLVGPYQDWILTTTGIPEPEGVVLLIVALLPLMLRRVRRG